VAFSQAVSQTSPVLSQKWTVSCRNVELSKPSIYLDYVNAWQYLPMKDSVLLFVVFIFFMKR